MRKHTTINLDQDLLHAAAKALGTTGTSETVHRALTEAVNQERRKRLLAYDFPGLTAKSLEAMRRHRTFPERTT